MRLDKYLGDHNLGTRKQIKEYLKNGRCTVNGIVAVKPDVHINELSDEIAFDGKVLSYARFHYFMLYKPAGVLSATNDKRNVTVLDLLKEENLKNLSPCGRLDIDTEGLLLITDDGVMIHNLLSPKKHVDKVYEVHIAHELSEEDIKRLTDGVDIGDKNDDGSVKPTLPAVVTQKERDNDGNPVIELTIHEGRFHQVKRMFSAAGNNVSDLKRIRIGNLGLDPNLALGACLEIMHKDVEKLLYR